MAERMKSNRSNFDSSLVSNKQPERITALVTGEEKIELLQGQYFIEKKKSYELWGNESGLPRRIKGIPKSLVLRVITE
jgi:hypothetical protein